jgi:hypothetical protein
VDCGKGCSYRIEESHNEIVGERAGWTNILLSESYRARLLRTYPDGQEGPTFHLFEENDRLV